MLTVKIEFNTFQLNTLIKLVDGNTNRKTKSVSEYYRSYTKLLNEQKEAALFVNPQ